jgi:hypothetical protein
MRVARNSLAPAGPQTSEPSAEPSGGRLGSALSLGLKLFVVGLLLALALAATAHAQGTGVIEGQVVNGTAGGPAIGAGVVVTLHAVQGDVEVVTLETTTDAEGRFRFEGLNADPSLEYWPEATYLDVPYTGEAPYQFTADQTSLAATVTVYETTTDDGNILLDSVHLIVESFGPVLRVNEIHVFGNAGDRTYVGTLEGDQHLTVFIPMPEEAVGLAFQNDISGTRYVEVEGGLRDTVAVPPGQQGSLVLFSYHLMVTSGSASLERSFAYPVGILNVLAAQPGLSLNSEQLQDWGPQSLQGQQYELYAAQALAASAPLEMAFTVTDESTSSEEMPASTSGSQQVSGASGVGSQKVLVRLGVGLALLALAAALVYAGMARQPAAVAATASPLASNPQARRLLADLAALEDAYEAGQVDDAAYQQRRAELYEALRSL